MDKLDRMQGVLRWTWVAVALVALYAGYTVLTRWSSGQSDEKAAEKEELERNRPAVELLGDGRAKILVFYGNPPTVKRGESGLICYGVVNVKSVKIEPEVEPIGPALSRCVPVKPKATTTYTLTATPEKGDSISQTIEIVVP